MATTNISTDIVSDAVGFHAEADLDAITRLAAQVFNMPASLISLIVDDHYKFKSRFGVDFTKIAISDSFCGLMQNSDDPLLITNALNDPRTAHLSLLEQEKPIIFYCGTPLIITTPEEHVLTIGSFSIMDFKEREFSSDELQQLFDISGIVQMQLQARFDAYWSAQDALRLSQALADSHRKDRQFQQAEKMAGVGSWHLDLMTGIVRYSDQACRILGIEPGRKLDMSSVFSRCAGSSLPRLEAAINRAINLGDSYDIILPDWVTPEGTVMIRAMGETESEGGKVTALFGIVQRIESGDHIQRRKASDKLLATRH